MKPSGAEKRKFNRATLRRVLGLFGPYRREVGGIVVIVLFAVVAGVLPPFFLRAIIDVGLARRDFANVTLNSIYTLLAVLAGAGLTLLYGYGSVVVGQRIMCDLRDRLFVDLQGMSLRFFTNARTGDIQTRLISDVGGVQTVLSNTFVDQLSNVAIVVSALVSMAILDWRLMLLSVAMVPFFALAGRWVGEFAKDVRKGVQEQTSELNAMMQETLSVSGILLTKTVGTRSLLIGRFERENRLLADWQVKSSLVMYLFFGMIRLITQFAPALVFWVAGYLLIRMGDERITVGLMIAFTAIQARLFFPITGLLSAQVEIVSSLALFERIFEYLDLPRDVAEAPDAVALAPTDVRGEVAFEDVSFRYEEDQAEPTLSGISFSAPAGSLVALVGPSGAGKTTLTYLIPRLYDPDQGRVTLDGRDVREIKEAALTAIVGAVTQETYLMHTTIAENLRIARPEATLAELEDACRAAAIHDHIAGLPEAYETVVGERGYKLSGGERQRLAIARAILKNPRVLILDEATSALDTHSERLIQDSLAKLMVGRTTFAIAHRLSTVLNADLILVVDRGRIVESGGHAELLARGGLYRRLYDQQFAADPLLRQGAEPDLAEAR